MSQSNRLCFLWFIIHLNFEVVLVKNVVNKKKTFENFENIDTNIAFIQCYMILMNSTGT